MLSASKKSPNRDGTLLPKWPQSADLECPQKGISGVDEPVFSTLFPYVLKLGRRHACNVLRHLASRDQSSYVVWRDRLIATLFTGDLDGQTVAGQ